MPLVIVAGCADAVEGERPGESYAKVPESLDMQIAIIVANLAMILEIADGGVAAGQDDGGGSIKIQVIPAGIRSPPIDAVNDGLVELFLKPERNPLNPLIPPSQVEAMSFHPFPNAFGESQH